MGATATSTNPPDATRVDNQLSAEERLSQNMYRNAIIARQLAEEAKWDRLWSEPHENESLKARILMDLRPAIRDARWHAYVSRIRAVDAELEGEPELAERCRATALWWDEEVARLEAG